MTGLAALAVAQTQTAYADLRDSDLWIGFSDNQSGFLLDEDTGALWMTGPCLKALDPAVQTGTTWVSHTIELVSIGRGLATLDQLFEIDTNAASPTITVTSNGRGGVQRFSAEIDRACQTGGVCAALIASQQACQG
ncbi:MAG: hypothetical protein ACX94B_09805 [Henriciella sp.]|nr:hypothetical protein [Hyphomonadaceae bacterium]